MSDPRKLDSIEDFRPQAETDFSEVALARKAELLLKAFNGRLPTTAELINITEELGVELGTAVFLRSLQESNTHGAFLRKLRAFSLDGLDRSICGDFEVAIVASNLFQSGRRWGDHAATWRSWARELEFKTEVIETDPRRSVAANARVIFEHLARSPERPRFVVTYGQGSAEMRYLLHRRVNRDPVEPLPEELENVRGWISICGAFGGASSSRLLQENRLQRLLVRLRMKVAGRNPITLAETTPTFPLWRKPLPVPKGMAIVSVVGAPQRWQVSRGLRLSYDAIAAHCPNDGLVNVLEASAYPGLLVPVAGMEHRASDAALEPVFKRILAVMAMDLQSLGVERVRTDLERE